jgi:hypothetical protein
MRIIALLLSLLLAGCANYGSMNPEAIAAAVKDKNASAVCVTVISNAGVAKFVFVNFDKATAPASNTQVNGENCNVTMITDTPPKIVAPTPPNPPTPPVAPKPAP